MKKPIAAIISVTIALAGCSTASKDIAANYVSPMQYQSYDCDQLASESGRIYSRVNQLGSRLDEAASNDKAITGLGVILFWPALFALGGTKQQEAEYARLKGESDSIQQASVVKKCPGVVGVTNESPRKVESSRDKIQWPTAVATLPLKSKDEKLKELKKLKDAGLISPEVYLDQQKTILASQ